MKNVLLFLLPIITTAKIEVNIIGRNEGKQPIEVYLSGDSVYPISNADIVAFQLSDSILKDGIQTYLGQRPDDVFLKNPTPIGDLYRNYGWKPVVRVVNATKATVLNIDAVNQTLLKQVFENASSKPATFNVGIAKSVANVMITKWSTNINHKNAEPITYTFDSKGVSGDWKTIISFNEVFGVNSRKTKDAQIGPSSAMQIVLQPGQAAKTTLFATLTTVNLEIEYTTRLRGRVIANYENLFNGHHFWSCDVAAVINNVGIPYQYFSKETIQLEFYWNVRITVRDGGSNKKLMEVIY